MTLRRKTSGRLTLAVLSLAAALALRTAPASAQPVDPTQPVEYEILDGRPGQDDNGVPIWCWPLHWLIHCLTR